MDRLSYLIAANGCDSTVNVAVLTKMDRLSYKDSSIREQPWRASCSPTFKMDEASHKPTALTRIKMVQVAVLTKMDRLSYQPWECYLRTTSNLVCRSPH